MKDFFEDYLIFITSSIILVGLFVGISNANAKKIGTVSLPTNNTIDTVSGNDNSDTTNKISTVVKTVKNSAPKPTQKPTSTAAPTATTPVSTRNTERYVNNRSDDFSRNERDDD